MKIARIISVSFFFIVLFKIAVPAASADSIRGSENTTSTTELRYFGFAVVDCGYDDPTDSVEKTNYIDEIAGIANIAQMCVGSERDFIHDRISLFRQAGVKAILNIDSILFEHFDDATSPSGRRTVLRLDANESWNTFVFNNREVLTPENIAALYVVDEPVWNGLSEEDFVQALGMVKNSFPEIPTMAIEGYPVVDRMMAPEMLDWIGFDRYQSVNPETDPAWLSDLEAVYASRRRPDQKIVILASTQWFPFYRTDPGISPEDMGEILTHYDNIASTYPDVVALVCWLWPNGITHPEQLGARGLPENVQQVIRDIGGRIMGNAVPEIPDPNRWLHDFDRDGRSDVGVYYDQTGTWYVDGSSSGYRELQFGFSGTYPVTGDFDGDGIMDYAVYYPPSGAWYAMLSRRGYVEAQFGFGGTLPVKGDFDGDGVTDFGVFFPPTGMWYLMQSAQGYMEKQWGFEGTLPVTGDFDGDGRMDYGVYDPPTGMWYLMVSSSGYVAFQFGFEGTHPVAGDFDGDGATEYGVYHPPSGKWYLMQTSQGFQEKKWGFAGTKAIP